MLTIERLIIHKVNHQADGAPQLSDLEAPLSDAVVDFLRGHIIANREHKNARRAHFNEHREGGRDFQTAAGRLFAQPGAFVEASQEMARLLFTAVRGDKRISPSDLFVCTFKEDGTDSRQLALLKMEPQASFSGEFEAVNGKRRFVLLPVDNVLPTGDLQKSAFILPPEARAAGGYDLRVVDQQIARFGARRPAASFFTQQFLGCSVGLNDADLTNRFVYGSYQWLKTVADAWPARQTAVFKERVRSILLDNEVDLVAFAAQTIPDPAGQEAYLESMVAQGLDQLGFRPDESHRRRWAEQVTYYGDNGLELRIDPDAVGSGRTIEPRFNPATGLWTVTITTAVWEEQLVK